MNNTDATEQPRESAANRAGIALKEAVASIKTPEQASRAIDGLVRETADKTEKDAAGSGEPLRPSQQADAISRAAAGSDSTPAVDTVLEAAAQSAASASADKTVVDRAVERALGGQQKPASAEIRTGQNLLREELIRRLHPVQAVDALCFIAINHLPHPAFVDRYMGRLSFVMTGGIGWSSVLLWGALHKPKRAGCLVRDVVPALFLATFTVESLVKPLFRRKRPFISLVRAIVVGRKPGSYSFPSGHSAAAFGGALLLSRQFPKARPGFFGVALLVAFSRIYLGNHYPGDVITGSALGSLLAGAYSRLLQKVLR